MSATRTVLLVAHWDWVLHNFRMPLARALRRHGWEVTLVSPRGQYLPRDDPEFPWIEWHVDRRGMAPHREAGSLGRLTEVYKRERPTVVHHFTLKPNLYGTVAARVAHVPRVVNTFTGLGSLFSDRWTTRLGRLALIPVMRVTFRAPNVWTVFQNTSDLLVAQRGGWIDSTRTKVIRGTGVDLRGFVSDRSQREGIHVLMASRLLYDKGVRDLVAAAVRLKQRVPSISISVAGEQDSGNPNAVSDADLQEWKDSGSVEFLGHVDDIPDLLARVDVAALPTYYPEGVPKFLLEAGAAGLPLVATDTAPCREIAREGENALLVPPRRPDLLAEAIATLAADRELRERMGRRSRAIVEAEFDEERVLGEYLALYDNFAMPVRERS